MNETVYDKALEELKIKCSNPIDIISGRKFFNNLSLWSQETLGVSVSAIQVIPYFTIDEIPLEIKTLIDSIVNSENI